MKKIGFIGAYDKIDLIIYIAKIITSLDKKVLVVDATINQKARYIIPAINPARTYITEYEEIDIAVGFKDFDNIRKYLSISEEQEMEYDYIFIDTDNENSFNSFKLEDAAKNYFVTSFDIYSLKKGLEILTDLKKPINLNKILFSKDMTMEENEFLNFLSSGYNIIWNENKIYFPIENGDLSVIYENQRVAKIRFKNLSVEYKDQIEYITQQILENTSRSAIRRMIKNIERQV
ncbi:MAG: hypothetical protein U0L98_03745 [Clostridia bacterium]|nr:hypothetical protein [Clostridia bacterium]